VTTNKGIRRCLKQKRRSPRSVKAGKIVRLAKAAAAVAVVDHVEKIAGPVVSVDVVVPVETGAARAASAVATVDVALAVEVTGEATVRPKWIWKSLSPIRSI
jgi:hypothetical protein